MSNNIIGKPHEEYVQNQIEVRQEILGKKNKSSSDIVWANGRSSWIRLASSVDIKDEDILKYNTNSNTWDIISNSGSEFRTKFLNLNPDSYGGNELAKTQILEGGILYNNESSNAKFGVSNTNTTSPNNTSNYGYGGNEFGLKPMPGITSFSSNTYNKGSLRKASLTIVAHNRTQFEYLEAVYLRLGYTMLLEWGNSSYPYERNGIINYDRINRYSLVEDFLKTQYGKNLEEKIKYQTNPESYFYSKIEKYREKSQGNYDAFFAKVDNFSWEFTKEGKYIITLSLISIGSVIESLTLNTVYDSTLSKIPEEEETDIKKQKENFLLNLLNIEMQPVPITQTTEKRNINPFLSLVLGLSDLGKAVKGVVAYTYNKDETNLEFYPVRYYPDTSGSENSTACFANFGETKFVRYIRFKRLLEIINFFGTIKDKEGKSILLEIDTSDQYCFSNNLSISSDPSKMIISYTGKFSDSSLVDAKEITIFAGTLGDVPTKIAPFHTTYQVKTQEGENETTSDIPVGNIMNLFFSYEYLESVIESEVDSETGNLYLSKFLNTLLSEANRLLGGVNKLNFGLTEKETETGDFKQVIEFYDEVLPFESDKIVGKPISTFNIYGFNPTMGANQGSFVTDFNLKTELNKKFSTMTSIGAQANSQAVGEDATIFSKWNVGLVDRHFPQKLDIDKIKDEASEESYQNALLLSNYKQYFELFDGANIGTSTIETGSAFSEQITNYKGYTFPNINLVSTKDNENNILGFQKVQKSIFQKFYSLDAIQKGSSTPFVGFLPVNFEMTFDGMSGIRIFDQLSIDSRFLPSNYGNTLKFIITQLDHKIQNNKWETTIGTLSVPKLTDSKGNSIKLTLPFETILLSSPSTLDENLSQIGANYYKYSALATAIAKSSSEKGAKTKYQNAYLPIPNLLRNQFNVLGAEKGLVITPLVSIGRAGGFLTLGDGRGKVYDNFKLPLPSYHGKNKEFYINDYKLNYFLAKPAAEQLAKLAAKLKEEAPEKTWTITSAYRNFEHQKKVGKAGAEPGSSPHGWGGAIDIAEIAVHCRDSDGLTTNPTINQRARATDVYKIFERNAAEFGWFNPYRLKDGFRVDEAWHWEFWGPPSTEGNINTFEFDGFKGDEGKFNNGKNNIKFQIPKLKNNPTLIYNLNSSGQFN